MIDWDGLVNGPCELAFGDPTIVYTAKGQGPVVITGIFDRAFLQQQPFGGGSQEAPKVGAAGNITALSPVLGVRLSQFATEPKQKDAISIPSLGLDFTIKEVRPDGKGWALLLLSKG